MDKQIIKTKLKAQLKNLAWRAITTVILTLTAVITVWAYAAFIEPLAGPNDSDQDFLQNILGANNADNDFDSSLVTASSTGSIIERLEQIDDYIDTEVATIKSNVDNAYSACYEKIAVASSCGYPTCAGGWTLVEQYSHFTADAGRGGDAGYDYACVNVCCLAR